MKTPQWLDQHLGSTAPLRSALPLLKTSASESLFGNLTVTSTTMVASNVVRLPAVLLALPHPRSSTFEAIEGRQRRTRMPNPPPSTLLFFLRAGPVQHLCKIGKWYVLRLFFQARLPILRSSLQLQRGIFAFILP